MKIKREITLELEQIEVVENPINQKGKYASYHFRTVSPSSHSFFGKTKPFSEEFTAVYGQMPSLTLYSKEFKPLDKLIWQSVFDHLPSDFPKDKYLFDYARIVQDYKGDWNIAYSASKHHGNGIITKLQRNAPINLNALSRILATLPTKEFMEATEM